MDVARKENTENNRSIRNALPDKIGAALFCVFTAKSILFEYIIVQKQ